MNREVHNHIIRKLQDDPAPYQEFRTALKIIGDKWSGLILLCLFDHPCRFGEIADTIPGLNPRTLTKRLRNLEQAGLISRREYKEFPPRTEYAPTEKAHELKKAIMELKKWAHKYCEPSEK